MKFYGKVGFWEEDTETSPGIWEPAIVEHTYSGDVEEDNRKFQTGDRQNDIFTVNNRISILADTYAQRNWSSIRYVIWNGVAWKVTSVKVGFPRILLTIGGVWNGEVEARTSQDTY